MTLPATDNFNRAAANPVGGNWTTIPTMDAMRIHAEVPNVLIGSGDNSGAYWNADSFDDDQYSQTNVPYVQDADNNGPAVRISTTTMTFYLMAVRTATLIRLKKFVAGEETWLTGGTSCPTIGSSTICRIEVSGNEITTKVDTTVVDDAVTDSTLTSGQAGLIDKSAGAQFDNWEGGNLGGGAANARKIFVGGAWKEIAASKMLVGGAWKAIAAEKMMVGGAWKAN